MSPGVIWPTSPRVNSRSKWRVIFISSLKTECSATEETLANFFEFQLLISSYSPLMFRHCFIFQFLRRLRMYQKIKTSLKSAFLTLLCRFPLQRGLAGCGPFNMACSTPWDRSRALLRFPEVAVLFLAKHAFSITNGQRIRYEGANG